MLWKVSEDIILRENGQYVNVTVTVLTVLLTVKAELVASRFMPVLSE